MRKSVVLTKESIIEKALDTFGNSEKAQIWMMSPNRGIQGKRPDELLDSAEGRKRLQSVLGRMEYSTRH